ncbi:MAG: GNAT family N-acetyltransferase/peptidase C39 family protein [Methylococcaceae bacterium]
MRTVQLSIRTAQIEDLDALLRLEKQSFATDQLSRRSFRHWITTDHRILLVAELTQSLVAYVLLIYHRGTRLARVYSLAVAESARGLGIARQLMLVGEQAACENGCLHLRLEVSVDNIAAIQLYESIGFQKFGLYHDYYEDHRDALRYQKCIRHYHPMLQQRAVQWFRQTTHFTCGPASLMMVMHSLDHCYQPTQEQELMIWREATTIFMTSGHGGCHPIGLALAAQQRGFEIAVWINQTTPLFVDGVRNEQNKQIVELVDTCFKQQAEKQGLKLHYANITQEILFSALQSGALAIVLISTYSMDRKKTPHWVVVSGFDKDCLYIHDPDPDDQRQSELDCQYIPIAREDFDRMSCFGKSRLRTALIIKRALKGVAA